MTEPTKPEEKPKKQTKRKAQHYLNNRDLLTEVLICKETGRINNRLAKMFQLLCERYAKKGNFANYCVDSETTALTKRGWLTYDEITTDDTILSYNTETQTLVWSKVIDVYINNEYDGLMHKLTTKGMDAMVTPDHKFVSVESGIKRVEDIICKEHIVLNGNAESSLTESTYTDSFVECVGWCVTEGHYIKGSKTKRCITVSQKEGIHCDKIRMCLQAEDIPYKEYLFGEDDLVTFNCTGDKITSIYDTVAPNRIPSMDFITTLTNEQRLLLIETMVNGDGWYRPNKGMSYVQKDPEHVDAFIALCAMSGLTASVIPRTYKTPPSKKNPDGGESEVLTVNIYATPKTQCKAEHIDFHGGRPSAGGRRDEKPNQPTVEYKGTIWCPQTEYGTFVCRRGRYHYVTGNTYRDDMEAYALLMLCKTWNSFNPEKSNNPFAYFSQCVKNSFIQFLNQERKQRDIRDELLMDNGLNPSYTYQMEMVKNEREKKKQEAEARGETFEDDTDPEMKEYIGTAPNANATVDYYESSYDDYNSNY